MHTLPPTDDLRQVRKKLRNLLRRIHALPGPENKRRRAEIWKQFAPLAAQARSLAAHHEVENGGSDL